LGDDPGPVVQVNFTEIDLRAPLEPIQFILPEIIPQGYITLLGAKEGAYKTTLLSGLAWQMSRPAGSGNFLGRPVIAGHVLYIDTDAPNGRADSIRELFGQHEAAYPDGNLDNITVFEADLGMNEDGLGEIRTTVAKKQTKLIIIDSFMTTFPTVNINRLDQALGPMFALRKLASDLNVAVLVIDHLPKKAAGERVGDRGIIGSMGKMAQARAVLILTSISNEFDDGPQQLCLEIRKASFARSNYSLGIQIDRDVTDHGVPSLRIDHAPLQNERKQLTRGKEAVAAVVAHFVANAGKTVPYTELLTVTTTCGLRRRAGSEAIRQAFAQLSDQLTEIKLPGQGGPRGYQLVGQSVHNDTGASLPLDAVLDDNKSVAAGNCHTSRVAPIVPVEGPREPECGGPPMQAQGPPPGGADPHTNYNSGPYQLTADSGFRPEPILSAKR
jgi:AAA domain